MFVILNSSRLVILAITTVMLFGCGRLELEPIAEDGVILAFGDSLTAGVGVHKNKSYPTILSELSGREVINAGVSGEVTEDGLTRLGTLLQSTQVDLLILLEGGNDILRNKNLADTKRNLAQMIEMAQGYNIGVVLVGVPEKKLFSDVAPLYKELAAEYGLVFEPEIVSELLRQPKYKSDSVHFNEQGYRLLAQSLYEVLVKHGAL